jgi:hypothetical protein
MLHGEVKKWQMTEEERLAYIEKHPIIKPQKSKVKGYTFANIHEMKKRKKK